MTQKNRQILQNAKKWAINLMLIIRLVAIPVFLTLGLNLKKDMVSIIHFILIAILWVLINIMHGILITATDKVLRDN